MLSSLGRPLRSACPSLASSSQLGPVKVAKRTAVSIAPPLVFSKKVVPRIYTERKRYKVNEYNRLLDDSAKHPIIFFSHTDFAVPRLMQLRKDVTAAALRFAPKPGPSLAAPTPAPASELPPPPVPEFRIINTNYFGVALREYPKINDAMRKGVADMLTVEGGLAVLTFPDFNPPQLNAVLKVLARTIPPRKPKTQEEIAEELKEAQANFVPGRRPKGAKPPAVPELKLVGAVIEGRALKVDAVEGVAKLPTLDTLRAQIVGLLSAPGSQLAAVLNEASGAKLARTLEGFKKSLEEGSVDAPSS